MTTQIELTEEIVETQPNPIFTTVRKTFLFGLGAVAYTQAEFGKLFEKFVARGEEVEHDGRETIKKMMERRQNQAQQAEKELDKRINDVLHRMNIPGRSDIKALNSKITSLNKKIEELNKAVA